MLWNDKLPLLAVVKFYALAQASDFRFERRQAVFFCWMQRISKIPDWASEDQAKNLNSIAHPCDQRAFRPLDPTAVGFRTWLWWYTCLLFIILMLWSWQAIFESKGDKLSSSAECRIRTQCYWNWISSRLNAPWQTLPLKHQLETFAYSNHL